MCVVLCRAIRAALSENEKTGPPLVGGAGFALAPRRLKRPIRRLRINASPIWWLGFFASWAVLVGVSRSISSDY